MSVIKNPSELAGCIDHTILKSTARPDDVRKLCAEAIENKFAAVCVNAGYTELAATTLEGSGVETCVVVGFPLGAGTTNAKAAETAEAVELGADEVDMVINVGMLQAGELDYVENDIRGVVSAARGKTVKVMEPEILGGLPVSAENLAWVQKGLFQVVQGDRGTARRIRIPGVNIAGKTGTAQVFSRKKGETFDHMKVKKELKDHAWFVCYAPAEKPAIAVSVIIEHGEHGSSQAAPIAGELIRQYLGIVPVKALEKK